MTVRKSVKERIETGVVLSGGVAKGAYQIGFCRALLSHSAFRIAAVSAASVGTLNGYALLTEKLDLANDLWRSVNIDGKKRICDVFFRRYEIYALTDKLCSRKDVFDPPFSTVLHKTGEKKPIYISLTDRPPDETIDFIKASVTVPPIMKPVAIGKNRYCDGAVLDNTPILPLLSHPLDLIISVQFDGYMPDIPPERKNCPILYLNLQKTPRLSDSFNLRSDFVESMISYGYAAGDDILTLLERSFCTYERFIDLIRDLNCQLTETKLSGDYLMRRLNRLNSFLK